jgi:hypothetical protein
MWADVLTKPLQGQKFRDIRSFLKNCGRDYDDDTERIADDKSLKQQVCTVVSSRECVGEHTKQQSNPQGDPPKIQRSQPHMCFAIPSKEYESQTGIPTYLQEFHTPQNSYRLPL